MKTLRAAYQNHLDSGVTALVYCLRIERRDGVVHRFTSHDRALTMDTGKVYLPDAGGADVSAVRDTADLDPNNFDLEGALTANGIARADIAAGLFDYAEIYLFRTRWDDPVEDDEKLGKGYWGQATLQNQRYVTEFRSLKTALDQTVGRLYTATCDADLGDARCQVRLDPPAWQASTAYTVREAGAAETGNMVKPAVQNGVWYQCTVAGTSGSSEPTWDVTIGNTTTDGTATWTAIRALALTAAVTSATDRANIAASALDQPDDWWGAGLLTFTSGANAGIAKEIKTFTSAGGVIELWEAFPFAIAVGDTFTIQAGCRKRFGEDCQGKFDNPINFQGFPHVPGENRVLKVGGQ